MNPDDVFRLVSDWYENPADHELALYLEDDELYLSSSRKVYQGSEGDTLELGYCFEAPSLRQGGIDIPVQNLYGWGDLIITPSDIVTIRQL